MIFWIILGIILFVGVFKYFSETDKRNPPSANLRMTESGSYVPSSSLSSSSSRGNRMSSSGRVNPDSLFNSGRYNLAYERFLQEGNIFKAALSLLMLGPNNIEKAVKLIGERNPSSVPTAVDNLVKLLYTKYSQAATAAALYRHIGEVDKAVAIEIATGISPVQIEPSAQEVVASPQTQYTVNTELPTASVAPTVSGTHVDPNVGDETAGICMMCDQKVEIGENFLTCRHCLRIGHYDEFYEWIDQIEMCYNCQQALDVLDYKE